MKISVIYIKAEYPLGTVDGIQYVVNPIKVA